MRGTEVVAKEVEVVKVARLANRNDLYQFMRAYLCFLAPSRPNKIIKFKLADASKPPLTISPSLLKPRAWIDLLVQYPGSLRIHVPMVLRFRAELKYEGLDAFIHLDNLASPLEHPTIIEKKLQEDLASGRVTPVHQPSCLLLCSPSKLFPKHDGG